VTLTEVKEAIGDECHGWAAADWIEAIDEAIEDKRQLRKQSEIFYRRAQKAEMALNRMLHEAGKEDA